MKSYAPIVIFAFNRLDSLKRTVASLLRNEESKESDLFVFVDGARENVPGEIIAVENVQKFVKEIQGFRTVKYFFSECNKGLAKSIIGGSTQVVNEYGKIIVLEDDLFVSQSFLRFMNEMLDQFETDNRIMQISGYGCKLSKIRDYPFDAYMNERAHSWSWATWKDRWASVDWNVDDFPKLQASKKLQKEFNKRGSDLFKMLRNYMIGKNNSWYIRFNYSMFKQHRYSIMPIRSLVRNDGFGDMATNCRNYNRYKVDFEEKHLGNFNVPAAIEPCEWIIRNSIRYWSVPYRVYGKLMTIIGRFL